ncbi:peptide chain release factor N(5)-glutamine methyltransferase [Novosphingobium sp.]|uniref:peptide chain release factor N(5)-glutamine methyltransferase n=1 Tax=Novosphingobium sp. TaxID=1874826 RepID=UPI00286B190A|nr:peptide chain release factor N(5)-glutamine methyltransferase [Novosphingobium sp.]
MSSAQTVDQAIRAATQRLGPGTDSARFDAELLMAHALGTGRSDMFLKRMGDPAPAQFADLVERRATHEPVAYIIGEAHFWGLRLAVSPAVLVPRADSETLIEAARAALADRPPQRILDLGTGSGCLLLAALDEWPGAAGVGIDSSGEALAVAARNADQHSRPGQVRLLQRDWHAAGWQADLGRFDLILANPPYVETAAVLEPTVRDHEPATALFAGPEGLDDYRVLIPQLPALLAGGGIAMIEIGATQAGPVGAIAAQAGFATALHHDLAERPRALELKILLGNRSPSA